MKRGLAVLMVLLVMAAPAAWVGVPDTRAASTMTIVTKERGSGKLIPGVCYGIGDLDRGGGVASACDGELSDADGKRDGTTTITRDTAPCGSCVVGQTILPEDPDQTDSDYLFAPEQKGAFGQSYTFQNYLKPYVVVSVRDAETNRPVKGACVYFVDIKRGGAAFGGCDGGPKTATGGDQDGRKNGKIESTRLGYTGAYRIVNSSPFPKGYRAAKPVKIVVGPLKSGDFEKATIEPRPQG